jgi:hypothetical protein
VRALPLTFLLVGCNPGTFSLSLPRPEVDLDPGASATLHVQGSPADGFSGDVQVALLDAPSGISADPLTLHAPGYEGDLVVHAAPNLKLDTTLAVVPRAGDRVGDPVNAYLTVGVESGVADRGFGVDGIATTGLASFVNGCPLAVRPDGSPFIGVAGTPAQVVHFTSDGRPDTAFGHGGMAEIPAYGVATSVGTITLLPDGGLAVSTQSWPGVAEEDGAEVRLGSDGQILTDPIPPDPVGLPDLPEHSTFEEATSALGARYLVGQFDPCFRVPGPCDGEVTGFVARHEPATGWTVVNTSGLPFSAPTWSGGALYAATNKPRIESGYEVRDWYLVRFTDDLVPDRSFGTDGLAAVAAQVDGLYPARFGKLVTLTEAFAFEGQYSWGQILTRWNHDGTIDTAFRDRGTIPLDAVIGPGRPCQTALDTQGRLLIGFFDVDVGATLEIARIAL